ncbi:hypothetical protein F5X98DRAFT_377345 [Xylaria grammica]|nr:hypothetical protein F5X98DRAFT_377345 [Xylaria grammica]
MDSLQSTLRNTAHSLASQGNRRLVYTTATTAAVALLAYSRHCYVEWLALGEGGVPRSLPGWLINVVAHLVARRDSRAVPAPYEREKGGSADHTIVLSASDEERYGAYSRVSFFRTPIPVRSAGRPTVPTTVVPQRQTTEKAGEALVARQNAYLAAVAAANPRLFTVKPSALESPRFPALWLLSPADRPPQGLEDVDPARVKWLPRGNGETAHVHHEGSTHVCMSLVDAAKVVRNGWGERHKLSGVKGILPWGYVLVYAPRENGSDWEVWKEIVLASARNVARCAGFDGEITIPK